MDRRTFLHASAGAAAASALALPFTGALAKAPFATEQAPSFYRFKVGTIEVTAVTDGSIPLPLVLFPDATANGADANALLAKAHRPAPVSTAINTYAVNTGDKLFLVDTGYGPIGGSGSGLLAANLKAAGIDTAAVDAVVLTHMHPDHVGGLSDFKTGQALFPNAALLVADKEYGFWTDEGIASRAPDEAKKFFQLAQSAVKPYVKRVQLLKDGEEIAPGLTIVAAPGHTPGHSFVRVTSGTEALLIWGDIVHSAALQFAHPEWAITFDTDQAQAIVTRKAIFDQVSADGTMVAGMHLDFPGLGYVTKDASGYTYERAFWSPKL